MHSNRQTMQHRLTPLSDPQTAAQTRTNSRLTNSVETFEHLSTYPHGTPAYPFG